jgi:hypothetical protein
LRSVVMTACFNSAVWTSTTRWRFPRSRCKASSCCLCVSRSFCSLPLQKAACLALRSAYNNRKCSWVQGPHDKYASTKTHRHR